MAETPTQTSPLSFAEIKELIAYAREQRVQALEVCGVKFTFSPLAHIPKDEPPPKRGAEEADAPFGHYRPE